MIAATNTTDVETADVEGGHQMHFKMFMIFIIMTSFEIQANVNYALQLVVHRFPREQGKCFQYIRSMKNRLHVRQTVPSHISRLQPFSPLLSKEL